MSSILHHKFPRNVINANSFRPLIRSLSYHIGNFDPNLNLISGKRSVPINSKIEYENINPATGKVMGKFLLSNKDDVDRAVHVSLDAYKSWKETTSSERCRILRKAANLLEKHKNDFAIMETLDTGKAIMESGFDIDSVVEALNYFASLSYNLNGEQVPIHSKALAYTIREPLGVCAGIGAWNFPISNIAWKTLPAIICGNTFIYKPSPLTPTTSTSFAEILTEAGLPEGVLTVLQGDVDVGEALCSHSDIAKISFTGSIQTGSKVMAACAAGIKKVTLELGGKAPLVIFEDADIDNAVQGALMANYVTQGEVCSNAARVYVHEDIYDAFMEKLIPAVRNLKIGDTMDETSTIGALISQQHFDKVTGFIDRAKKEGARILHGGTKPRFSEGSPNNNGFYLTPCLMDNCTDDMEIVREEHFGPIMSVLKFKDEAEVVTRANNTPTGLAAGVFSRDISRAHRVIHQLNAGACYVNTYNMYPVQIPFGGHKMSGIGMENGTAVLNHYTQLKSIYVELGDVETMF